MNIKSTGLFWALILAVCTAGVANAQNQVATVPVASAAVGEERFVGTLCGNQIDMILKRPTADAHPELKKYYGVWGEGAWDTGTCNAIIVTDVTATSARVHYYSGSGPRARAGTYTREAQMYNGELRFPRPAGQGDFGYYKLVSANQLDGRSGQMTRLKVMLQKRQ